MVFTLFDASGQTLVRDPDWPGGRAAVDYYFIQDDGGMFKCTLQYEPYFHISCKVNPVSFYMVVSEFGDFRQVWKLLLRNGL